MTSFSRSLKRKKQKERKKALKKGLEQVMNATAGMPSKCTFCSKEFNEQSDPDKWYLRFAGNSATLCCSDCNPNV